MNDRFPPAASVRDMLAAAVRALAWIALCAAHPGQASAADSIDYEKQIKPIFAARCVACHGALKQAAGLRLDTAAAAMAGGDGGPALRAKEADASLLVQRLNSSDPEQRMPQEGEPLKPEQIELVRRWINEGATAPVDERPEADPREHWSFQSVRRPAVPAVHDATTQNPVDAFVLAQLAQHGLRPQVQATRSELIRRVYLDLLGLPPSPAEWAQLDADQKEGWYERLVNRLLDDPRHGQRWGRHWMDVWRYSDWWGLGDQLRNSQLHLWHYRDWIVESLNADLPYDEMIRLMLAADELHPTDLSKLRATGYLARNYFLFNRNQWMDETVEHVSKAFLGLTTNCAKCHDHKYDPLDQTDYYRFRAIFEPYHVRLDMTPGEADLARNAVPRVFDGELDQPTYRFIRGQESAPDKSTVMQPGVPAVLSFGDWTPTAVDLPAEAWAPERRAWVADALRSQAAQQVAAARTAEAQAAKKAAEAQTHLAKLRAAEQYSKAERAARGADPAPPEDEKKPFAIQDRFEKLDEQRWQVFGGQWKLEPGKLQQLQDGADRAGLRLRPAAPVDFDASVRFTLRGGSRWRSVSLVFDSTADDPARAPREGDSEQTVYVSGVVGGSKVQGAYAQHGRWTYPVDGLKALPIAIGKTYVLRVQARGTLINASLNGEPVLSWRTPQARTAGAMQLTTFDALADFHEFTLEPLAPNIVLREPGAGSGPAETVEAAERAAQDAEFEWQAAQHSREVAESEGSSLAARIDAWQARWRQSTEEAAEASAEVRRLHLAAATAQRKVELAKARRGLILAQQKQKRAEQDKRDAADKEAAAAAEAVKKAEAAVEAEPTLADKLTPLTGARWTATRFRSSGADDPAVAFPPRSTGRRTALAQWLTDRRQPLTARVAVNHVWARHLGAPLVPTVFDFGRKGTPPTHPELLDWLAAEFMDNGWSFKHLHRTIMLSAAYRRSSSVRDREAEAQADPENRLLWRRPAQRLESQAVRDSILALAGTLDVTAGGPPIPAAQQADSRRRSLYFFHSNNDRNLFLTTFDEALVKECYRREQSIVPQQALALTNSRLVLDAAPQIAAQLNAATLESQRTDDAAFARAAFRSLLGIDAAEAELQAATEALAAWRAVKSKDQIDPRAWLIWSLLNHNDFVTLR
ncbi:MAG: PSD1 and planctomycete cytochrome C domain-containing protein [Pirellulales bacterium]